MDRSRHNCWCILCALIGLALAWLLFVSPAAVHAQPAKNISFIDDVAPIFKENCFACHDAKKKKGKFDMTTFARMAQGGGKGEPFKAGKPKESLLIHLLTSPDASRMPPRETGDPLTPQKIELISKWIEEGA